MSENNKTLDNWTDFSHDPKCPLLKLVGESSGKCGFVSVMVYSESTRKSRYAGIMYKTSAKDKGVMMNFCPICGEKIDSGFT